MTSNTPIRKILILAANPRDTPSLRLDEEIRDIREALQRSQYRDQFALECRTAVRPQDVRRALLDIKPHIVHFSGHGVGEQGLVLENEVGKMQLVSTEALVGLFELFSNIVECVLLNACYSKFQADAICQNINYVIGMNQPIGDRAAIEFAVLFYDALGAQHSIEFAHGLGCNAIAMAGIAESQTPVLLRKPGLVSQSIQNQNADAVLPMKSSILSQSTSTQSRVFISYRSKEPDLSLAQQFYDVLKDSGHNLFMAGESIRLGETWAQRIDDELEQCDYFLLLLSPQSAISEMVTEEVRRAKQLQDERTCGKPTILPIRVNFPMDSPLNYDLRGYLQRIQQREWKSQEDTPKILKEILSIISGEQKPETIDIEQAVGEPEPSQLLLNVKSGPPVPVAEPELPEGQVDLESAFYMERPPIETRCYEAILRPGALIRIKAPRQMGKTSLFARILHHAKQQGCLTISLSFQIADAVVFSDLDKLLRWFCANIGRKLKLQNRVVEYWDDIFGSKDNCTAYFEEYLLPEISNPLVIGLDEVDMVFSHPGVASDFLGLLRAWHESSKNNDLWKKLRLVIVHSTEVYIPMSINQSPFNVGLPIDLPEFEAEQILRLARSHGLDWNDSQIQPFMKIVGGHPYLVRVGLYHVARQDISLEDILEAAPTEAGLYGDHLRRHLWNLEQHPELMTAVKKLVENSAPVRLDSLQTFKLHSMGLVRLQGNNVKFRYSLYEQYFRDRLRG